MGLQNKKILNVYIYTDTYIHKYMVFNSLIKFKHIYYFASQNLYLLAYVTVVKNPKFQWLIK